MSDFNNQPNQNPVPPQGTAPQAPEGQNVYNQQNYYQPPTYNPPQYQPVAGMEPPPGYIQKSRIAAGILAILLGAYGVHSFYLGNTSRGLMQLLISLLTFGIGAIVMTIWGVLDGVKLLDGRINTDAYGIFLKD